MMAVNYMDVKEHIKQLQFITARRVFLDHLLPLSCLLCRLHCPRPLSLCVGCTGLVTAVDLNESQISEAIDGQPWQRMRYLSAYKTPLKELIQTGKFDHKLAVFKVLGQLLDNKYSNKALIPN